MTGQENGDLLIQVTLHRFDCISSHTSIFKI